MAPASHKYEVKADRIRISFVRYVRRCGGSRGVPDVHVGSAVSGVRPEIALVRYL